MECCSSKKRKRVDSLAGTKLKRSSSLASSQPNGEYCLSRYPTIESRVLQGFEINTEVKIEPAAQSEFLQISLRITTMLV
jgi:hypothetical protein